MSAVDLSRLPPPDVVESIDFETLLAERKARLLALTPADDRDALAVTLALESEPINILLQENTYREIILRQRINDAARAVMLSSARGADLDHLAALLDVKRLVAAPGDQSAVPPIPPVYEADSSLRARTQLAPEGFSTAGPAGAYRFHALSAHGDVADASIDSPEPGRVRVTVLSRAGDGTPCAELLAAVDAALNAEDVRPLTDEIIVAAAQIVSYTITAKLVLFPGPAPDPVLADAQAAAARYVQEAHRLGYYITLSGIYSALHRAGVQRVVLISPAADIICSNAQAPHCAGISIAISGVSDA